MITQIVIMGAWLTIVSFVFLKVPFFKETFFDGDQKKLLTGYFVLFIASALFNGFGIFKGLNENTGFLKVFFIIILVQALIVNAGLVPVLGVIGEMFSCVPFGITGWVVVFVLAFTMIPVDMIRKIFTKGK